MAKAKKPVGEATAGAQGITASVVTRNHMLSYKIKGKSEHLYSALHGTNHSKALRPVSYTHLTLPTKRIV